MDKYYNLDVLADVLAKALCMSGVKPVIGRNQCQLGMNGIKKGCVCMGDTRSDSSSKEFILQRRVREEEEICVRTICKNGVWWCVVGEH